MKTTIKLVVSGAFLLVAASAPTGYQPDVDGIGCNCMQSFECCRPPVTIKMIEVTDAPSANDFGICRCPDGRYSFECCRDSIQHVVDRAATKTNGAMACYCPGGAGSSFQCCPWAERQNGRALVVC